MCVASVAHFLYKTIPGGTIVKLFKRVTAAALAAVMVMANSNFVFGTEIEEETDEKIEEIIEENEIENEESLITEEISPDFSSSSSEIVASEFFDGGTTETYYEESEAKNWLRELGFYNYWDENTEIITDFENDDLSLKVVFGENDNFGDKITAEFIDDILTITVHDVSAEQWKKAYLPGNKMYCANIYWSFPETVLADQFCGHAYFEKWIKDELSDSENFIYSRNWGNGRLIANFFLCDDQVSVVPQNIYNGNKYLIIAYVEDGEINYKVLVFRVVIADDAKAVTFDDPYKGGFVPMSRMEILAASEKMQPLTEKYENGTLVFSYNGGKTTVDEIVSDLNIRDLYWTSNHFIVSAPEGYVLEKIMRDDYRWSEVEENAVSVELDFPFGEDGNIWTADMTYTIAWRNKDDGRIIHETLTVRNDFGKKFNPLDVYWDPVPAERVAYYSWDEDVYLTEKDLEVYGILTDYSEETGCVRTKFSEDPDLLSLGECLAVVTPPEGAVYFRCNHSSGSKAKIYRKEDADEQKWYIENFDYELVSEVDPGWITVLVSDGRVLNINGKKYVYQKFAEEEEYRCVVEWYDKDKKLITGEYLYNIVDPYFEEMKVKTFSGFCGGDETAEYDEGSDARKNLWWEIDENGVLTIGGKGPMKDYEWTSKANGVWSLTAPWAKYSFMITDLVIEDGVTKIGEESFDGMEQLKGTLDLPDSIEEIGPYAFAYTGFSGELKLPKNLKVINIAAFEGVHCSGNLVIPSGVKKIYVHAFENGNYESVFIPNTVDEIIAPFPYCYDLRNIEFEDGSIYCFENGAVLDAETKSMLFEYLPIGYLNTSIAIPETVTWIKGWAFGGCYLPNNFVIPETVEKIGPNAFRNTVTDFYFLGDAPEMDEYTFYNEDPVLYENVTLHYISTKSGWTTPTWNGYKTSTWTPDYTVTFNANGGEGAPESQIKIVDTGLAISDIVPTRFGYNFKWWSGSDGNTYNPGDVYTANADLTLTAVWEEDTAIDLPRIIVSNAKGMAGSIVNVDVKLKNNPGISGIGAELIFDSSMLEFVGAQIGSGMAAVKGAYTYAGLNKNGTVTLNWNNPNFIDFEGDYVFATVSFRIREFAKVGDISTITVQCKDDNIYDSDKQNIDFLTENGTVGVTAYTPGDIDGNGNVSNKDVARLFNYISKKNVEVVKDALDVNGDGSINNRDVITLFYYVSLADVEIF